MNDQRPADGSDIPRMLADKLSRRCWSVPRDDLRQEAEAAALHARTHYNPEKGDIRGYLYRSVARHLTNYMWELGSPVSYKHRRSELRAVTSVDVEKAASIADPTLDHGAALEREEWRTAVVVRATVLAGPEAMLVGPCLFGIRTPLEVSRQTNVPLMSVLEALARVRELIGDDPIMAQLYAEIPE